MILSAGSKGVSQSYGAAISAAVMWQLLALVQADELFKSGWS